MIAAALIITGIAFVMFAWTMVSVASLTGRGHRVNYPVVWTRLYLYAGLTAFVWIAVAMLS